MSHASGRHLVLVALSALPLAALPVLEACGLGSTADLFGRSSGGETEPGDGGRPTSSSGSGDGGSAPAGGGDSTSGSRSVSASSAEVASSSVASSSGSAGTTLPCDETKCELGEESACCWDNYDLNDGPKAKCVKGPRSRDDCNTGVQGGGTQGAQTRIECQVPAHCPGQICCGEREVFGATAYYSNVSCQNACNDPDRILCDVLDAAFVCPLGTFCQPSDLLPPGYAVCGTP